MTGFIDILVFDLLVAFVVPCNRACTRYTVGYTPKTHRTGIRSAYTFVIEIEHSRYHISYATYNVISRYIFYKILRMYISLVIWFHVFMRFPHFTNAFIHVFIVLLIHSLKQVGSC